MNVTFGAVNMSNTSSLMKRVLLLATFATLSGCATVQAPRGYLPGAKGTQWDVYGGWITVKYSAGDSVNTTEGEFIGLRDSLVYVLTESEPVSIRCDKVRSATIDVHTRQTGTFAVWTTLGSISVLSHGMFMIFSFPMWLLTGIPNTVSASYDGRYATDDPTIYWWQLVSKFSRFPQGIPKEIHLQKLKLKHYYRE